MQVVQDETGGRALLPGKGLELLLELSAKKVTIHRQGHE
jgi:hypothetical protein